MNGAWAELLRQLMAADLVSGADEDRLLRAHWLTYYNPQSRQWKGSRSVKDEFDLRKYKGRRKELLDSCIAIPKGSVRPASVSAMRTSRIARFFSIVQRKSQDPEGSSRVGSAKLGRVGVIAPFLPLLLAAREHWPNDPEKYLAS